MTDAVDETDAPSPPPTREDRAPIVLRVDYKKLNTFFADYTKNISKGGTFIRTTKALDVGTEFLFLLALPDRAELALKGVVKWSVLESAATAERPAGMGIEFVFANDEERLNVDDTVAKLMHDALGPTLTRKLLRRSA